ncbi:permease [Pseudochelatococcus sp. B33]
MKHDRQIRPKLDVRKARRMAGLRSTLLFLALSVVAGLACYAVKGADAVGGRLTEAGYRVVSLLPHLVLGLMIAAAVTVLVPRERVARWLGEESGLKGLAIASFIGAIMPGGPFASFPLVFALAQAGADAGALIAFLIAWAAIGVNRLVIWEIPFMGFEFSLLRFVSSLPLPVIAGVLARLLCRRYPGLRG